MDDRLSHNLRCIEEGFAASGFEPERRFPTGVQLYVNTAQALLSLSAFSSEEGSWIVLFGSHPARVPVERRAAVLEAMARINYQQAIGNFDLDVTDGEMRYRIGHGADAAELTAAVVERLLGYLLYTWGRFHDALMSVAYGGRAAEDAVRDVIAGVVAHGESGAAPASDATEAPVDVDMLLKELGLAGPIGSRPAERAVDPMRTPEAFEVRLAEWATEMLRVADAVDSQAFPEAYIVPGTRLIASEYPGAKDLTAAREKVLDLLGARVTHVIDLTCAGELTPFAELLAEEANARGVTVHYQRRPIRDVDVCTPEQMRMILDEIDEALASGGIVYVHCWGGAGRTGTVVGCWLVRHGRSGEEALAEVQRLFETMSRKKVARHPEGSPQTEAQREMVREWVRHDVVERGVEPHRGS